MAEPHALSLLEQALRGLPGVGARTASRMAFHLLQNDRSAALALARALQYAVERVGHCERCHTFSETPVCATCADPARDTGLLCVVETPADQLAIERTGTYKGLYFVLMGKLSPLDGVGPQDIGVSILRQRVSGGGVREVILATNFTAEGEVTAHVLAQWLRSESLKVSRLARGVPAGSELEYVDLGTIAHALSDRR